MTCRFCSHPAVAQFSLPGGCFCYPNDREQDLCPQHIINAEPIKGMKLVKIHDQSLWDWMVSVGLVGNPKET